jgi:hypothetical protein
METLVDGIVSRLSDGRFATMLKEYCLRWQSIPSTYAIENVVAHLSEEDDPAALFKTLTDSDFRLLKKSELGVNALRSDLQKGLSYFSGTHPNLLCYLQVLFLEHRDDADAAGSLSVRERYCQEFSSFLQLDAPPARRQDVGIQNVLHRIFPFLLGEKRKPGAAGEPSAGVPRSARVEFVEYELGTWHCRCKAVSGQGRRFDYSCPCGASRGNGVLDDGAEPCPECGGSPAYERCDSCGTRVALDLLWLIQEGALHPCQLKVPLSVTLSATSSPGVRREMRLELMQLPIMLSLRERDEQIGFDIPDVFWIDEAPSDISTPEGISSQVLTFHKSFKYAGQTTLRLVLESMLLQTLMPRGGGSIKMRLREIIFGGKELNLSSHYTKKFIGIFTAPFNEVTTPLVYRSDLTRAVDLSLECIAVESPLVNPGSVIVNRDLRALGALRTPHIMNYSVVLKKSPYGEDALSAAPAGTPPPPTLADDGIVIVGTTVQPGDILVGVEEPRQWNKLTAGEKFLAAIFDHPSSVGFDAVSNASLTLQTFGGIVLGVNILASKKWRGRNLASGDGRVVKLDEEGVLQRDELARINVTVASDQLVEVGDTLYSEDGTGAVVCQILGSSALAKMAGCAVEPDLLVAPGHAWAPPAGSDQPVRQIRVRLKNDLMLGSEVMARGIGPYSIIHNKPLSWDAHHNSAQELQAEDFDWLLSRGAVNTAFELNGPRCDCKEWRNQLYSDAVTGGRFRLADLNPPRTHAGDLSACPSENIKYLSLLLRGLGIRTYLGADDDSVPKLTFALEPDVPDDGRRREVTSPDTINARTYDCLPGGLFCERIFGPNKDYECACGKYMRRKHAGVVCERCGVEVTERNVRGQRVGYIALGTPVVNPLYASMIYDHLSSVFNLASADLETVARYGKWVMIDKDAAPDSRPSIITDEERFPLLRERRNGLLLLQGAEAIQELIASGAGDQPGDGRREHLRNVIMDFVTVIPPDRRPIVQTGGGSFATSDLNDLYRRLVNRAIRLKKFIELRAPDVIVRKNGKALMQDAIDHLFDNHATQTPLYGFNGRPLKSIVKSVTDLAEDRTTLLDGLLRRPVDFSGRTRLVVGETTNIDSALVPERLMWSLFQPLIYGDVERKGADRIKLAREETIARTERAYAALTDIARNSIVLVSPSSSEWRLVALRPVVTSDLAVTIHPELMDRIGWENLGKPVRVFAILSEEAAKEAEDSLLPSRLSGLQSLAEDSAKVQLEKGNSIFYIDREHVISEISRRALTHSSHNLNIYDQLILCIRH